MQRMSRYLPLPTPPPTKYRVQITGSGAGAMGLHQDCNMLKNEKVEVRLCECDMRQSYGSLG